MAELTLLYRERVTAEGVAAFDWWKDETEWPMEVYIEARARMKLAARRVLEGR